MPILTRDVRTFNPVALSDTHATMYQGVSDIVDIAYVVTIDDAQYDKAIAHIQGVAEAPYIIASFDINTASGVNTSLPPQHGAATYRRVREVHESLAPTDLKITVDEFLRIVDAAGEHIVDVIDVDEPTMLAYTEAQEGEDDAFEVAPIRYLYSITAPTRNGAYGPDFIERDAGVADITQGPAIPDDIMTVIAQNRLVWSMVERYITQATQDGKVITPQIIDEAVASVRASRAYNALRYGDTMLQKYQAQSAAMRSLDEFQLRHHGVIVRYELDKYGRIVPVPSRHVARRVPKL
mgnify:CR=1 FL=1